LKQAAFGTVAATAGIVSEATSSSADASVSEKEPRFKTSLAGWSLHKAIYGNLVKMLDFPRIARQSFGIEAIELVNTHFEVPT